MSFKPAIWYPIAVALSAVNGVAAAVYWPAGPMHGMAHAALAFAFGAWAVRLRHGVGSSELQAQIEMLQIDLAELRQLLVETQERLDFAERLLAQEPLPRRVDPER